MLNYTPLPATYWIQRCWLRSKASIHHNGQILMSEESKIPNYVADQKTQSSSAEDHGNPDRNLQISMLPLLTLNHPIHEYDLSTNMKKTPKAGMTSPLSPRRRRALERESMIEKVRHMVSSPFPYMVLILLVIMIVMIFVDVMPIAGVSP
jgi:hypothetical protein